MEKGRITSIKWGSMALRGFMAKLFALSFLIYPAVTVHVRILLFAIFALLFGILSIWSMFGARLSGIMILEFLQGVLSIAISLMAFFLPGISNAFLILLIATWAIIIGILKIILGFIWSEEIPHKWVPKTSGIIILIIGLFLIIFQLYSEDIVVFSWYMAAYIFIFGLLLFIFALDLRVLQKRSH
jgi:uncharacterized membrane protein HdeD (DUF308 family)